MHFLLLSEFRDEYLAMLAIFGECLTKPAQVLVSKPVPSRSRL